MKSPEIFLNFYAQKRDRIELLPHLTNGQPSGSFWISRKQAAWLAGQFASEQGSGYTYNWRDTAAWGDAEISGEPVVWEMHIQQNRAGSVGFYYRDREPA